MKKRNCRMTSSEREQHDRAVRIRKMTDAQLCAYLDSMKTETVQDAMTNPILYFLKSLRDRTPSGLCVSAPTIHKLQLIAIENGFIGESEADDC